MRRSGVFALVLVLGVCGATSSAFAAAEPQAKAPGAHGDQHGAVDDSPFAGEAHQILDLAIWTIVVFLLLAFVMSRFAWKPMLAGLQQRESNIREALAEAQKAREEAAVLRAQYQAEINQAHLKVKDLLDEARRVATTAKDEMIASARTEIQSERDRANRDIAVATDQALQTIWAKAADLATEVSAAALGKQLDATMHRRLIDESLNDLRAASQN